MFQRIANSFAFRFPVLFYKNWLTYVRPGYKGYKKPAAPFNYVVLCGAKHYPFLKQALISVHKRFSSLPVVYLFTDLGFPENLADKVLKENSLMDIRIITAQQCFSHHENEGNRLLVKFAKSNPMGLKLAAILQASSIGRPLLYADTDVLWLNDPLEHLSTLLADDQLMHMSYDYQPGYDFELIKKADLQVLMQQPFYCAGLMLIKSLRQEDLDIINDLLPFVVEHSEHLTEQTMFAYLQKTLGTSAMSEDKYALNIDGQFAIKPSIKKEWLARHYIGPVRHLFWRDAFFYN